MNWIVTIVTLLLIVLIGTMFYAMPLLTPPAVPLGVNIPSAHVSDPAVSRAVKRYRIGVIAVTAVAVLVGIIGAVLPVLVATLLPFALELVGILVVYLSSRSSIQQAKRNGDWYHDVPVRRTASITADGRPRTAPAFGWYIAGLVVLAAVVVIGASLYSSLPNPVPVHWNAEGEVDRYAEKNVWSVFGPILIGIGTVALLFLLGVFMPRWPIRAAASDSAETSTRIAAAQLRLAQDLLGQIALLIALEFSCLAIVGWLAPHSPALMIVTILLIPLLLLGVVVLFMVRYRRAIVAARTGAAGVRDGAGTAIAPAVEAPDDDRFWRAGWLYLNRADPALMVPKRFGVGWTVNLGHPAGMALGILTSLLIAGAIALAIATGMQSGAP